MVKVVNAESRVAAVSLGVARHPTTCLPMISEQRRYLSSFLCVATALLVTVCRSPTGPEILHAIKPADAIQVAPTGDPWFTEVKDSTVLLAKILVPDSTLHVLWLPSRLVVESSLGFRDTVTMVPFACLLPEQMAGLPFPDNFIWRSCDRVVLLTRVPLDSSRVGQLEALVSGRVNERHVFSRPLPDPYLGVQAQYSLYVPAGLAATAEAMRRLKLQPEAIAVDRGLAEPICRVSGDVPPPPCPPWHLQALLRYTFTGTSSLDSIPVEHGGWIKVTYPGSDGSQRSATYTLPQ